MMIAPQTETGWPIAGMQLDSIGTVPGSCSLPLPGFDVRVLDATSGQEVEPGILGSVAIKLPFPPGCMQALWNDTGDRFRKAYLDEFPGTMVGSMHS